MSQTHPLLDIAAPQLVIAAEGDTPAAQANARGHLFEVFVGRLFEAFGCDAPTKSSVNVRQNGYEVDISTRLTLTKESAIAECKAYSSVLPLSALSNFYGKLCAERLGGTPVHGWFVAIPGLTADGHELARRLEAGDARFKLVTAHEIYALVQRKQWVRPIEPTLGAVLSDHGLLVTRHAIAAIAKLLDPTTRLPVRILVQRREGNISDADLALLKVSDYVGGLPVQDYAAAGPAKGMPEVAEAPTLVTVVGSGADFEYQFPAAPAFFVGREDLLERVRAISQAAGRRGRVLVLNAQSGWGKSSLALRIADLVERTGGSAIVFDTRTASAPPYVAAALRKAMMDAQSKGLLKLPADASFASLQSALLTLHGSELLGEAPLLIFFDQFENVFRDARLTREFRDFALAAQDLIVPVIVGFSWKTDLVGLTENYPYRLRDEIRGTATVINVEPFGPKEVGTLLGRLAKVANTSLSSELKQRLREYSQGLPWLLKKLASHILTQLQAGTSEETLLAESLNIEALFQQDLAALEATEVDALKAIAREAPVPVSDIVERIKPNVVQSLVDQRLVVRVGERIDVYWDTFREFLLTGKVAVEDTYILRLRAASTAKLLQYIVATGHEVSAQEAARALGSSLHAIFNAARELRQLGVLVPKSGGLLLSEQLRGGGSPSESEIRQRIAKSLRRHTVFARIQKLMAAAASKEISLDTLASEMPALFPAVAATPHTWRVYAVSFGSWLDYSNLVQLRGQVLCEPSPSARKGTLLSVADRVRKTFPQAHPDQVIAYLRLEAGGRVPMKESARQKAQSDLYVLGLMNAAGSLLPQMRERAQGLMDGSLPAWDARELLAGVPGGRSALLLIEQTPDVRSELVGAVLREAYGLPWAASTTKTAGTRFRAWARLAGVAVRKSPRAQPAAI